MPLTTDMRDVNFLLRKAEEYRAKARETHDAALKIAFEAAAREFESRAKEKAKKNFKPKGGAKPAQ